ncbi:zinc finger CCCH domain-containing protein 14 isoform X2 [Thalassophryne amazonica]|uniref:zinc finger CCCH domain-containing protein 14 isoform X2 n=1 Tax=Thalassophryne amazonica TaxID=390379 RepID=UPI00147237B9|nr:zinc finger CCCH domain-containing protein 14 isoform X2 [Thalassophryne amazonica]
MEIGAEISKKIRAAIKGKLQELGAYIDEELPDYIMVMVANKKTSQQMADDLSLFLGNNTIKFTAWLHGVLEKLRSVTVEPAPTRHQIQSDSGAVAGTSRSFEDSSTEEPKGLTVSSSRSDRMESRVSSSAAERRGSLEKSSSRLTSTVKPLMEPLPSEAVIDIKPELDDDLIAEEPVEIGGIRSRSRGAASRPTAEIYRPVHSRLTLTSPADTCRPSEGSSHNRSSRPTRTSCSKEELSRKRKAPVASSVVRVNRVTDEDSDDMEEEDAGCTGRGVSSRVSLPSKPERKPTLPPAKQANRNLILKAISEAQDSITKTTAYASTVPISQRQTVPVAPRTRLASPEEMTAAIHLVQEHLHSLAPRVQASTSAESISTRTLDSPPAPGRSLASRLQLDVTESSDEREQCDYVATGNETKTYDTRSFIMSQTKLEQPAASRQQQLPGKEEVQSSVPRTVQASKEKGDSPKFIVTLDGVPSPLGNLTDSDMDEVRPPAKVTDATIHLNRDSKVSVLHRLQGGITSFEEEGMDFEMVEDDCVPLKKHKSMERCKFWPVCKSGDECMYHHPTTQCKTFPNCKFGDKCLFVHPNCKYDARCTKPDCPFTHVSRRGMVAPPPRPAVPVAQTTSACRFFPDCKKTDCPFYHPKPCRFAAQCKRAGCTFYHPTQSVPPRHALKWTKAQSR